MSLFGMVIEPTDLTLLDRYWDNPWPVVLYWMMQLAAMAGSIAVLCVIYLSIRRRDVTAGIVGLLLFLAPAAPIVAGLAAARFPQLTESPFVFVLGNLSLFLAGAGLLLGLAYSIVKPKNPITSVLFALWTGIKDVLRLPFGLRRIYAVAVLTVKESIRRRVLYVFILFFVPFLFAGWYLPNRSEGQLLFLVAFVNTAMTWILLPLVLFMTAMSLPADIKSRTIQTVVTKPVHRLEILLGRIAGFMAIYTVVVAIMGGVSLLYLRNQVSPEVLEKQWTARIPIYANRAAAEHGPLFFVKNGVTQVRGTNVGKEWGYRSHIEGTDTAHFWFAVPQEVFAGQPTVRCEFTFDIFKTTKGDPTREGAEGSGVLAYFQFKDLKTNQVVFTKYQRVDNHRTNVLTDVPADIFKDGLVDVTVQCVTKNQFLGMATYDLYFLAGSNTFEANFLKGLVSIWLKVLLLTCVAVAASTTLNGFVTALLTVTIYVLGIFHKFLVSVVTGQVAGGGPIESLIRLVTQNNQVNLLDRSFFNDNARRVDDLLLELLYRLSLIVPDLSTLDATQFVAEGFDIPIRMLLRNVVIIFAYVAPMAAVGYFLFQNREIAE